MTLEIGLLTRLARNAKAIFVSDNRVGFTVILDQMKWVETLHQKFWKDERQKSTGTFFVREINCERIKMLVGLVRIITVNLLTELT